MNMAETNHTHPENKQIRTATKLREESIETHQSRPLARFTSPLLRSFFSTLTEKAHKNATLVSYASDIRVFLSYLSEKNDLVPEGIESSHPSDLSFDDLRLLHVTSETIQNFIQEEEDRKSNVNTIYRRLACLSSFYSHLQSLGLTQDNPVTSIHYSKASSVAYRREFPYITDEHLATIETGLPTTFAGLRTRVVVKLVLATGAKSTELSNLDVTDITPATDPTDERLTIRLKAKDGKPRLTTLSSEDSRLLERYLAARTTRIESSPPPTPSNRLLINKHNTPISNRSIRRFLDLFLVQLGIPKEFSLEDFRIAGCRLRYEQGETDLAVLSQHYGIARSKLSSFFRIIEDDMRQREIDTYQAQDSPDTHNLSDSLSTREELSGGPDALDLSNATFPTSLGTSSLHDPTKDATTEPKSKFGKARPLHRGNESKAFTPEKVPLTTEQKDPPQKIEQRRLSEDLKSPSPPQEPERKKARRLR